jgi:hypothetical protein
MGYSPSALPLAGETRTLLLRHRYGGRRRRFEIGCIERVGVRASSKESPAGSVVDSQFWLRQMVTYGAGRCDGHATE